MPQWRVSFLPRADRRLAKLVAGDRKRIVSFLLEREAVAESPRRIGKPLSGAENLWRYRVGDYRIIVRIEDDTISVFGLDLGHRQEIYR